MLTGIFWLDDGPQLGLRNAVARATAYYRSRFHREPTLCLVPPGAIPRDGSRVGGVALREYAALPPHHLWIGIDVDRPLSLYARAETRPATFSRRLLFQPVARRARRSSRP